MKNIILFIVITLLVGCSASEETSKNSQFDQQDVYVFDDVTPVTNEVDSTAIAPEVKNVEETKTEVVSANVEATKQVPLNIYSIQVGAFTTEDRAKVFIEENQSSIIYKMSVFYNDNVKLYCVKIPPYASKEDAEKVRDILWTKPNFKDAFIITEVKK